MLQTGCRCFYSRWGHWNFSSDLILLFSFIILGDHSASNKERIKDLSWGVKIYRLSECPGSLNLL